MFRQAFVITVAIVAAMSTVSCRRSAKDHLQAGEEQLKAKKYADASLSFRNAIQKDGKLGEAHFGYGISELEMGNAQTGFDAMRQAAALLPNRIDVQVKMAELLLAIYQGDMQNKPLYDSLRALSDKISLLDKNSFDALRMQGNLALLDRKADQAIEYFQRANQIRPLDEYLVIGYAQALIDSGKTADAEALGRQLIAKKKDFGPIYDLLYRSAVAAKREGDAEALLKEKVRNNPSSVEYALQLAGHYLRLGNKDAAQSFLQGLLDARPPLPKVHLQVGDFYLQSRDLERALSTYEQAAKVSSADGNEIKVRIANVRVSQSRPDEALAILDEVIAKAPELRDAAMLKANVLLERGRRGDLDSVIALYTGILKTNPGDSAARVNLGRAHLHKGELQSARKYLQDASQEAPADDMPKMLLATVNLLERKPDDAVTAIDEVIQRRPNDARARYLRFAALMELKRLDEASGVLEALVKDFPRARDLRIQQGLLAIAMKRYKVAETIFTTIGQEKFDDRVAAGLAETFLAQQQFERAFKLLSDELRKDPAADSIRMILAKAATQSGKYDLAISEYQNLLAKRPNNPSLLMEIGNAYREQGQFSKAIEQLKASQRLNPKDPMTHLALGMAHFSSGNNAEAIAAYRQAVTLQPDNPIGINNLAYSLAEVGTGSQLDEALQLAQKAVRLRPRELDYKDTLGWVFLKKSNLVSAVQVFRSLCQEMPANASYQHHLGVALLASKDAAGARKAFELALRAGPAEAEAAVIRKRLAGMGDR